MTCGTDTCATMAENLKSLERIERIYDGEMGVGSDLAG